MPLSLRINVQACKSIATGVTRLFTPAGLVLIGMSEVERERERGSKEPA